MDDVLKHLYKPKVEFLTGGDVNTDYIIQSTLGKEKKKYNNNNNNNNNNIE